MTNNLDHEVTARAIEALRGDVETFTRAQVAYLIALTLDIGADDIPTGDDPAYTLAYRDGYARGEDTGYHGAYGEIRDAFHYAFAGPPGKSMKEATDTHARAVEQRRRRKQADNQPDRPHGLRLDDPDWPPVGVPGTVDIATLRGVWPCPCPRNRFGGHITPKNPDHWAVMPGVTVVNQRGHLALVGQPESGAA